MVIEILLSFLVGLISGVVIYVSLTKPVKKKPRVVREKSEPRVREVQSVRIVKNTDQREFVKEQKSLAELLKEQD